MVRERFVKEVVPLRSKLLSYAQRFIKNVDEAEDIVQEVFLKLYLIREKLDSYKSIYALALTMVKNASLTKIRNGKNKLKTSVDEAIISNEPNPYVKLEHKDNVKHVMRVVDTLPYLQQLMLKMKHVEGMTIAEIAELTGSKPEAVRVNLSRARKKVINHFTQLQ